MKALRIHPPGGLAGISYDEIPKPTVGVGEVLVQVYGSGVSPLEITWSTSTGELRPLPATLGYELSGIVTAVGDGVEDLSVGEAIYGMPDFKKGGTQAEYVVANAVDLTTKPTSISHVEAAAVPLSALSAWQGLFEQAHLAAGQTVLIHGAAGGVGLFAVQLAHWAGAKVIATASKHNHAFLAELGADELIDYTTTRFEDVVHEVDVVLDTVSGDTLERSINIVKRGGVIASLANSPSQEQQTKAAELGVRVGWFLVHTSREQLIRLGELIDGGHLKAQVEKVFPLSQGVQAYEEGLKGHNRGKLVLQVTG